MRGRGIMNVRLTLTDSSGQTKTATTSAFGYYHFEDVTAGATYIISAAAKRFVFSQPVQVLKHQRGNNGSKFHRRFKIERERFLIGIQ